MSTTSSKVQAFLQRAKKLNLESTTPAPLNNSAETRFESPSRAQYRNSAPSSMQSERLEPPRVKPPIFNQAIKPRPVKNKVEPKSLTPRKVTPSKPLPERRPIPPKRPDTTNSPAKNPPPVKNFDMKSLTELKGIVDQLMSSRKKLEDKILKQQQTELELIKSFKKKLQEQKQKPDDEPNGDLSEMVFKKKAEQILNVVKEEAHQMDKKLLELQQENDQLRAQLSEQLTSSDNNESKSLETEIIKSFVNIEINPNNENYKQLCVSLSKKLIYEQLQRLKTQEQGAQMIEQDDKMIAALKEKISALEGMQQHEEESSEDHQYEENYQLEEDQQDEVDYSSYYDNQAEYAEESEEGYIQQEESAEEYLEGYTEQGEKVEYGINEEELEEEEALKEGVLEEGVQEEDLLKEEVLEEEVVEEGVQEEDVLKEEVLEEEVLEEGVVEEEGLEEEDNQVFQLLEKDLIRQMYKNMLNNTDINQVQYQQIQQYTDTQNQYQQNGQLSQPEINEMQIAIHQTKVQVALEVKQIVQERINASFQQHFSLHLTRTCNNIQDQIYTLANTIRNQCNHLETKIEKSKQTTDKINQRFVQNQTESDHLPNLQTQSQQQIDELQQMFTKIQNDRQIPPPSPEFQAPHPPPVKSATQHPNLHLYETDMIKKSRQLQALINRTKSFQSQSTVSLEQQMNKLQLLDRQSSFMTEVDNRAMDAKHELEILKQRAYLLQARLSSLN